MDTEDASYIAEDHFNKFCFIINTIEGILIVGNPNVWNVIGGLNRTKKAVFDILTSNLRSKYENAEDFKPLNELFTLLLAKYQMTAAVNSEDLEDETNLLCWIEEYLLAHTLQHCLTGIFNIKSGTKNFDICRLYKEYSFVKNEILMAEFLTCLEALQQNSMDRLSSLNPSLMNKVLFLEEILPWINEKIELEAKILISDFDTSVDGIPDVSDNKLVTDNQLGVFQNNKKEMRSNYQKPYSQDILMKSALTAVLETPEEKQSWHDEDIKKDDFDSLRNQLSRMQEISRSESCLFKDVRTDVKEVLSDQDIANSHELDKTDINAIKPKVDNETQIDLEKNFILPRSSSRLTRGSGHSRSKSDQIGKINYKIEEEKREDNAKTSVMSTSLPKENIHPDADGGYYYQSRDGALFPKPYEGQSLISYLDSRSYDTGAQLDKENAHFSICEALITAMEQMRCQKEDSDSDDSDPEIQLLKRKIIERRKYKSIKPEHLAFSDRSDTTGRSSTSFKTSSLSGSSTSSGNTDENHPSSDTTLLNESKKQLTISASWENVSIAKAKSLEIAKKNDSTIEVIEEHDIPPEELSAEAVAKYLLKKFNGQSLPAASELKWIVTEEEVPQTLLPLPTAWPVSPDQNEDEHSLKAGLRKFSMPNLLRGNYEWAPPRAQIIFSLHPYVKRKVLLQRQHFRCAGCGLRVSPNLSKRFRFCEYIGKYFCSSCHQNKLSVIPAKVLSKWDFKKYYVSDFAKDLLKKIHKDPLFNIADVAPNLYENIRVLSVVKNSRLQLHYIKKFIDTCRHAESLQKELEKLSLHISSQPHSYSMYDLVLVKVGELQIALKSIVNNGINHIKDDCILCSAKGFVCEFCRDGQDILYPFEIERVTICAGCKTCCHRNCYIEGKCGKCARIKARKKLLLQDDEDHIENS